MSEQLRSEASTQKNIKGWICYSKLEKVHMFCNIRAPIMLRDNKLVTIIHLLLDKTKIVMGKVKKN